MHKRERTKRLPRQLQVDLDALSESNSRSSYLKKQASYFSERRKILPTAIDHYKGKWLRRRAWERHIREQKSLTDFVHRLRALQRDKDVPIALAYGSWGGVAGQPNAACNKGQPSCIGKGLRQKLSKHFLVLSTPEAYTSKTCSICQSECGPCKEVDHVQQLRRYKKATTDEERRRALRFSVRAIVTMLIAQLI